MEFFGPGVSKLSIADRATISNMCPEYGATCGFFPVDDMTVAYLRQTSTLKLEHLRILIMSTYIILFCSPTDRGEKTIAYIEAYLKAAGMFRDFQDSAQDPIFSEVSKTRLVTC